MYSLSRDSGFHKTPVVKSLLVLTSASSLAYRIAALRSTSYSVILLAVRVWALPSAGLWLAAAMILYQSRVLERRLGSAKFANLVVTSGLLASLAGVGLFSLSDVLELQLSLGTSSFVHVLVGILAVHHVNRSRLLTKDSIPFYLLTALFSFTSVNSALLTLCGMLGGLLTRFSGLRLPHLPNFACSLLQKVVTDDTPPHLYTGATIQVQRSQRTDEIERMMIEMQQRRPRRTIRIGRPVQGQLPQPSEDQIQQVTGMGFSREDARRALIHTGSNVEAAIQFLTAARH